MPAWAASARFAASSGFAGNAFAQDAARSILAGSGVLSASAAVLRDRRFAHRHADKIVIGPDAITARAVRRGFTVEKFKDE